MVGAGGQHWRSVGMSVRAAIVASRFSAGSLVIGVLIGGLLVLLGGGGGGDVQAPIEHPVTIATPEPTRTPVTGPVATLTQVIPPAPTPAPPTPEPTPEATGTQTALPAAQIFDPHLTIPGWADILAVLPQDVVAALGVFEERMRPAMYAIGCAETGWEFDAIGDKDIEGGPSFGWSQLFGPWFRDADGNGYGDAYPSVEVFPSEWKTSPVGNAHGALRVLGEQGLRAWSTWNAGGGHALTVLAMAHGRGQCHWN